MAENTTIISLFLQGVILGVYAAVIPGPTQAFIFSQVLRFGWRKSASLAFVPLVTDLPIGFVFCVLFSQMPVWFLLILRIVGGGVLLILAYDAYQSSQRLVDGGVKRYGTVTDARNGYLKAMVINFTNPNVYIFWGTIGAPIFVNGWGIRPLYGLSFILGMYLFLICVTSLLILILGLSGNLALKPRKVIGFMISISLMIFAASQFFQAIVMLIE